MLKRVEVIQGRAGPERFAIVASEYNARYVDAMVRAARAEFLRVGVKRPEVVRVPGAFEIPVAAARMARTHRTDLGAIVCLGLILRGETTHAQHIGETVSWALGQLALQYEVPVVHEVLLLENEAQAKVRCLQREFNRGREAAQTALRMARIMAALGGPVL